MKENQRRRLRKKLLGENTNRGILMAIGCKRCGKFCSIGEISVDPNLTLKELEFVVRRVGGTTFYRDPVGHLKVVVGRCPYLAKDGITCLIYENRPEICAEYPVSTSKICPGCRYYDEEE